MTELGELYQEVVMAHGSRPRNFRRIEDAEKHSDGYNPFCGDMVSVFLKMDEGRITDAAFVGKGCAISKASASIMTEAVKGKTVEEAQEIFESFHKMVTRGPGGKYEVDGLGELEVLAGVAEFPTRVKCAVLAWHTLKAALKDEGGTVSTE
ncbi:MAG: SUF system NifU family Fe-S cluster assembly protein [SAR202 cluster bacterium]|nr:SUF system NifU family Fe-S cluster assembly protein [SAR202 cluster bacterium]